MVLKHRLATGTLAGLVAVAGLALPAHAATHVPVPLADAGTLTSWYQSNNDNAAVAGTVPEKWLATPFSQVAVGGDFTLAVTSDNRLAGWGSNQEGAWDSSTFPAGLDGHLAQVEAGPSGAVAVKDDGTVEAWPSSIPINRQLDGLTGVESVSTSSNSTAVVLRKNGAVTGLGKANGDPPEAGIINVPAELQQPDAATQVAAAPAWALALTTDGRVVAWGWDQANPDLQRRYLDVPAELQQPGAGVQEVVAGRTTGYALTAAGKVVTWGGDTLRGVPGGNAENTFNDPPASLADKTVVDLGINLALTSDGEVVQWGFKASPRYPGEPVRVLADPPASLVGRSIGAIVTDGATLSYAVVTTLASVALPTVGGTVKSGSTLTGTPGTFSGGGTVTNQWFAGNDPIEGATGTSLTLTDAQIGKTITFRSTSVKGEESKTSSSTATAAVTANVVASTVKATAASGTYGSTGAKVSVTVTPSSAGGKVQVLNGSTKLGEGTLSGGKAAVTLSKTAFVAGSKTLTVKYLGDSRTSASQGTVKVSIAKASASVSATATKTIKVKKTKAKVAVTVKATGTTPTGSVSVYLGKTKVGSGTLKSGKASVTLKAFAKKGTAKLTVKYAGSTNVNAASKTIAVRVS